MTARQTDRLRVRVMKRAIDVSDAIDYLGNDRVGAVDVFVGVTRRITGTKETTLLEYDCYESMAVDELTRICEEALEQWEIERVTIDHRIGRVPTGEASVIVAVAAPHRDAAFKACRYGIDELKRRAPIWKRESFADGSRDWVEGEAAR